jgi:hypothetical protein
VFACLHTLTPASARLVDVAKAFTPRFEVVGAQVMLDARGLSRIFGEAQDLGRHLLDAVREAVPDGRVAVATTQTTAALLALGRPGLTLAAAGQEAASLAALPLSVLGAYERLRIDAVHADWQGANPAMRSAQREERSANGEAQTANSEQRTANGEQRIAGWQHPRDTHQAHTARRPRRIVTAARRAGAADEARVADALRVLHRWGIHTLGALAALPPADLSERLGPRGARWQRLARGEDARPLVPWVEAPPYEAALDLEWPIEGLEPLSFVLGRLLEPLAVRLEHDDRGAAVLYTRLRLVSRETHTRVLQLPAPMRDPRALRTLVLLDLESHPPSAAIDRVAIALEPAPGRVVQEALFTRATPPPEQVATLTARLTALMGAGHVGTPVLVDTWRPGAFQMTEFTVSSGQMSVSGVPRTGTDAAVNWKLETGNCVLRRFRMPVPVRVRVVEGRPVRVMSDRHGVAGGAVVQCAGPWRASGDWWQVGQVGQVGRVGMESHQPHQPDPPHQPYSYDRDEWDVAMADGTVYRIYVERQVGRWFIEGMMD